MPIKIAGKVLRNIPEQVAKNTIDIKELKEEQYQILSAEIDSGHLILHLYNGDDLDVGVVKGISYMDINGSQHLIVHYNDGTTEDLGAIFSGNISISGDLSVSGEITGSEIIEDMVGYSYIPSTDAEFTPVYVGVVKNGNKLTFVVSGLVEYLSDNTNPSLGRIVIPKTIWDKLVPLPDDQYDTIAYMKVELNEKGAYYGGEEFTKVLGIGKYSYLPDYYLLPRLLQIQDLTLGKQYYVRVEFTALLNDNLAE